MCGIAGFICFNKDRPTREEIRQLHESILHRGTDASGMGFLAPDNRFAVLKAPIPADELHKRSQINRFLATIPDHMILHTRATTKGSELINANNHPVEFGNWIVVHNGMIRNDDGIFNHYRQDRFAEVDTASIPLVLDKEPEYLKALSMVNGSWAIAAVQRDPFRLIIGRENNPVSMALDMRRGILFWASEGRAMDGALSIDEGRLFSYKGFNFTRDTRWKCFDAPRDFVYEIDFRGLITKNEVKLNHSLAPSVYVGSRHMDFVGRDPEDTRDWHNRQVWSHPSVARSRAVKETVCFVQVTHRIVNERQKVVAVRCTGPECGAITSAKWLMKVAYRCPQCDRTLKGWRKEEEIDATTGAG